MRKSVAVLLVLVSVGACVVCFFAGKRYGAEVADSSSGRRALRARSLRDRTSLFKLLLKTDPNDEEPLAADSSEPAHALEREVYALKSQRWLKGKR
jgi:hypothetical protein